MNFPAFHAACIGNRFRRGIDGFSLVELLIVIAVIGILASLVISQIANAAQESRRIVSRQQQVVVQNAVNAWILAHTSTLGNSTVTARKAYNETAPGTPRTAQEKLALIADYLDADTLAQFITHSDPSAPDQLRTDAMAKTGRHLELPEWAAGASAYPQVDLLPPN